MKGALTEAVSRLGVVADDTASAGVLQSPSHVSTAVTELAAQLATEAQQRHSQELLALQEKCNDNTAEVLKLVLALKGDVTSLKKDVFTITERQDALQRTVDSILEDRRSEPRPRSRICSSGDGSGGGLPGGGGRSSGAHSNDSGVALLLERAHQAFQTDRASPATSTLHRTSDQDSLPEQPSLLVPPLVYDYVAGLSATTGQPLHSSLGTGDQDDLAYDSDSSLTLAANKSISLSATISKEMRAGMASSAHSFEMQSPSDGRGHIVKKAKGHTKCNTLSGNNSSTDSNGGGPAINRTDSDGSDQSRDVVQLTRRRRYEKGSSSSTSKLYGPICRSVSQDSTTYQPLNCFGSVAGHNLYSHTSHHHYLHRDSRDTQRCRVARDLLDTEKKYCRTLWIIQDTFAEPLKKSGILSQKDINTLFPVEVYQLYDKHCHLQHQLRERLASWQWQPLVGDILAKFTDANHSDVLRLYTTYVNDFPEVLKTFHKLCRSSPPFTKFIKSCLEQPSCGGLDLGAFLLTPVQRIPRYILLLKQLLRVTDESHPDFHHVNVCLNRLKDFLDRLNDSIQHSFQLVQATFSPGNIMDEQSKVTTRHHHGRVSRSPRRTRSTIESPTYSPERPTSRSMDRGSVAHEDQCVSRTVASPKRSISITGGPVKTLAISKRIPQSSDGGRSRSLPRAVPLSPVHSQDDSSSELLGGRPARPLPSARSVADMTQAAADGDDEESPVLWEELAAASEPPMGEPQSKLTQQKNQSDVHVAPTTDTVGVNQGSNTLDSQGQSWQEAQDENTAKKKSIKSSLKNIFTFKKRNAASPNRSTQQPPPHHYHHHHPHDHHHHHHHSTAHHHPARPSTARGMRDESDYWDPQAQAQDTATQSPSKQPTSALQQPTQAQQSLHTQGPQTPLHAQAQQSHTQQQCQIQATVKVPSNQKTHTVVASHSHPSSHYQSLSSLPHLQTPLHTPHPPSTPIPGQLPPPLSIVGDFVDEDGNPCSNV